MARFKLFRYRKPSLRTIFGVTKAKRRLKRELGIRDKYQHPIRHMERTTKRKLGYYSPWLTLLRFLWRRR